MITSTSFNSIEAIEDFFQWQPQMDPLNTDPLQRDLIKRVRNALNDNFLRSHIHDPRVSSAITSFVLNLSENFDEIHDLATSILTGATGN